MIHVQRFVIEGTVLPCGRVTARKDAKLSAAVIVVCVSWQNLPARFVGFPASLSSVHRRNRLASCDLAAASRVEPYPHRRINPQAVTMGRSLNSKG
jgi:hypothetical protein